MRWLKERLFKLKLNSRIQEQGERKIEQYQNSGNYICILFDESQIDSMSDLETYITSWMNKGKRVETFSFLDIKEFLPEDEFENKICRKDLNWYDVPNSQKANEFINKAFDILITINPLKKNHLHFLNAASKSKFKIGLLPDELDYYNLVLDCEKPENVQSIFTDIQSTLDKLAI